MITREQVEEAICELQKHKCYHYKIEYAWFSLKGTILSIRFITNPNTYDRDSEKEISVDLCNPNSINEMMEYIKIYGDITTVYIDYDISSNEISDDRVEDTINNVSASITHKSFNEYYYPGVLKKGDVIFIVTVVYTDGNTFGSHGGYTYLIGIYKDIKEAEAIKRDIDLGESKLYRGYQPWTGYFASLDYILVSTIKL